VQIHRLRL